MYHVSFPPQSNRASWLFTGLITDLDDIPIDLSLCSLVFQISPRRGDDHDYGYSGVPSGSGSLMASTANGKLTIVDLGTFQWGGAFAMIIKIKRARR
jgi:hypothetical protein